MTIHNHRQVASTTPRLRLESGFALIVALLLMVALSFLGVTALRNVSLQEKMVGNYYHRSVALQESEGTLRTARQVTESAWKSDSLPASNASNSLGIWNGLVMDPSLAYFSDPATWSSGVASATGLLSARPVTVNYGLEQWDSSLAKCGSGETCRVANIRSTARAVDPVTSATVVTQEWAMFIK